MGDGIGGAVLNCLSGDTFEMSVSHFRKDNTKQYDKMERIKIAKIDNPEAPQYEERSQEDLERALKGKFVTCNVQYRDEKTDILLCNVFVQKPPEGF
jgi:endonuclease YncB( thermonuclease family)